MRTEREVMSKMNNLLYEINDSILALTESLNNGEIDQQAYIDTIENLGAENAVENVVKSILNYEAEVEAVKKEKWALDDKQKQAEKAAANLRSVLVQYMTSTNTRKVKAGIFNVSKGSTQGVELMYDDVENYPEAYLIEQKPKLDKRKLLADLKNGEKVDGAVLKSTDYVKIH